jgi:hypothetical protein
LVVTRYRTPIEASRSPADLIARYARKLPLSVICELLALPTTEPAYSII